MTSNKAPAAPKSKSRFWQVGLAASLLLTAAPLALHAETSNTELAKEIADLKAQIRSLKGSVAETRRVAKKTKVVVAPAAAPAAVAPVAGLPAGAVPVFATADKKMIFGNLTITPGGFVDLNGIFRSRTTGGDVNTPFAGIPTLNSNLGHVSEDRFSIRQSRLALLIEAPITPNYLVAGYVETDFNQFAAQSIYTQTTGFPLRVRHFYATLDSSDYGFHLLAGQNWSLLVLNSKGITPRNEVLPPSDESSVLVGYDYARTPQIRLVKDFNKKLWLAVSAEESGSTPNTGNCGNVVSNTSAAAVTTAGGLAGQNSIAANGFTGVTNGTCLFNSGFGTQGVAEQTTLNKVPDVIGKVAYEARILDRDVHLEAEGIYRNFTSVVNYGAVNAVTGFPATSQQNRSGGGVGAGIIAAVIPRKLDFEATGEYGLGLGRYTSSGVADATVNATGQLVPLLGASANAGFIFHATSAFDLYAFAGFDQLNRNFSNIGGVQVGYGLTGGVNNTGCSRPGGTCQGQTHRVFEINVGFNDKIYKGQFGEVRVGLSYEFLQRELFGGTANANGLATAANPYTSARATDHVVYSTLKYFPFQ